MNDGRGRADFGKDFAVDVGHFLPFRDVHDVNAGADDVIEFSAECLDCGADDLKRSARLVGEQVGIGSIGVYTDRTGYRDDVT